LDRPGLYPASSLLKPRDEERSMRFEHPAAAVRGAPEFGTVAVRIPA